MAVTCDEKIAALHAFALRLYRVCNESDHWQYLEELIEELDQLVMALPRIREFARAPNLIQIHELHDERDKLELLLGRCDEDLKSLDTLQHRSMADLASQAKQRAELQAFRNIQERLGADSADFRRFARSETRRRKILIERLWDHLDRLASDNLQYHFLARVVDWVALEEELKQQRILDPEDPDTGPIPTADSRVDFLDEILSPGVLLEALPSKTPSPVQDMPARSPVPKDKRYQATVEDGPDDDDELPSLRSVDTKETVLEKTSTEVVEGNVGDEASDKAEYQADPSPMPVLRRSNTDMIEKTKHQQTLQEMEEEIRRLKEEAAVWNIRENFRLYRHRYDTLDERKLFAERQKLLDNPAHADANYYVMPSGSTFPRDRVQDKSAYLKDTHLENVSETGAAHHHFDSPIPHHDRNSAQFFTDGLMHDEPSALFDSPIDQPTPPSSPHSAQTNTPDHVSIIEKPLLVTLEDVLHGATKYVRLSRRTYDKYTGGRGSETRTLEVPIKKGLKPGSKIKFRKAGDQGPNTAQDIHFVVQYVQHRSFSCDGSSDLYHELDLSADQAAMGWHERITTIDGDKLDIEVPPHAPPDWKKVCRGYGLPRSRNTSVRGDLIILVNITTGDRGGVY
ncbi:hypothetical protein K490DRAFT_63138 [Saccharata proteae CBS 121410]|uniref:Chaperone DnaJ C-terminal domain-containing protein n=1 Tax=Saccharata proteae CBS 121410 TaxID=1314787 RepID=A0A9P4HZ94_9PEZI|nr:hypothetical protein K490DRAFT_63138 [Saccharata proteae CBS 121410]